MFWSGRRDGRGPFVLVTQGGKSGSRNPSHANLASRWAPRPERRGGRAPEATGERSRRDAVPRPDPLRRAVLALVAARRATPIRLDGHGICLPTLRRAPFAAMTGEVIAAALVANDRRPRGVLAIAGVVLQGAAMVAAVLEIDVVGLHTEQRRTGAAHGGGGAEGRRGGNTAN